jgi:hypothetical protein
LKRTALAVLAVAVMLMSFPAQGAEARDFNLAFVPGKSYAVVSGAVVRGDLDSYFFDARPGQLISIAITSVEDNAVIEFWVKRDGEWIFADSGVEIRTLYGALPESDGGQYRIVVGGTRGNATYDMFVGISAAGQ